MKIYLIKASARSDFSKYKAETGGPPQNIFSTAAATPQDVEIEMADETIGMKTNFFSQAELVAIFMSTPDALRAYEIADKFRAKNKTVVLGGLHTKFMPAEAAEHADTLLIGEPEEIWEQLLGDYKKGRLEKKYERTTSFDLSKLNPYPIDVIKPSKYNYTWSVLVSRGCPMHCDFCLVHEFFDKFQLRPVEKIVEEVNNLKKAGVQWVELHSDNLTANRGYAIELFKSLAPLKMNFYGETTILIAKDEELLQAAKEGGVKALLFGIETPSEEALIAQGKGFIKPEQIKEYVQKVKSYDIEVWSDFLFGFDEENTEIFQETQRFIKEVGIDRPIPHLMIPFPGSKTFEKLDAEGRILTKDWSKYDGSHAVHQPKKMTPEELENGVYWLWKEINRGSAGTSQNKRNKNEVVEDTSQTIKWKAIFGLSLILLSIFLNWSWLWGVLFLAWVIPDIKSGYTHLFEIISKHENPILYWLIIGVWILLSLYSFTYSLKPEWFNWFYGGSY